MRKKGTLVLLLVCLCLAGKAQIPVSEQFHLDIDELRLHLVKAPYLDNASPSEISPVKILIPTPKGTLLTFQIWEDPILSADLQAEYPDYHTYTLQGEDQPYTGRIMVSPAGLDAVIICDEQVLFIEAVDSETALHRVYYWKLGSSYLSFDVPQEVRSGRKWQGLRLAVLADDAYAHFHQQNLARSIFASVNGVNAFLQLSQGIHLDLHYFATVDRQEELTCRAEGFQGRAAESIKLFGDRIADGRLALADFDLGQLFSGRGFGGSSLAAVAGMDTYYDWNEDGIFDGPAKAGGGLGAARPIGANWWGNLCKEIDRQIKSSNLAVSVQQSKVFRYETTGGRPTAYQGDLEHFPVTTMKYYSGPGTMGEVDFPHLSCLPYSPENTLYTTLKPIASWRIGAFPRFQISLAGGTIWPLLIARTDEKSIRNSLLGWRF